MMSRKIPPPIPVTTPTKTAKKPIFPIARRLRRIDAGDRENPKAHGVAQLHDGMKRRRVALERRRAEAAEKKHRQRRYKGHLRIDGVLKHGRRRHAQQQVADDAASRRRRDPQHNDAKQIKVLFNGNAGPRNGKGNNAHRLGAKQKA